MVRVPLRVSPHIVDSLPPVRCGCDGRGYPCLRHGYVGPVCELDSYREERRKHRAGQVHHLAHAVVPVLRGAIEVDLQAGGRLLDRDDDLVTWIGLRAVTVPADDGEVPGSRPQAIYGPVDRRIVDPPVPGGIQKGAVAVDQVGPAAAAGIGNNPANDVPRSPIDPLLVGGTADGGGQGVDGYVDRIGCAPRGIGCIDGEVPVKGGPAAIDPNVKGGGVGPAARCPLGPVAVDRVFATWIVGGADGPGDGIASRALIVGQIGWTVYSGRVDPYDSRG